MLEPLRDQLHIPSPLQRLFDPLFAKNGIKVFIKREDLIHEQVGGNKWRKLQFNLQEAIRQKSYFIGTFGGAYSNHIYSVASAGALLNIPTIGIIRGEEVLPLNPTLQHAVNCGMQLHYLSRQAYREKNNLAFRQSFQTYFPDNGFWIPEGGTNSAAIKGVMQAGDEIISQMNNDLPDFVAVAAGTGGTAAGLIQALHNKGIHVLVFSALKGDFLQKGISAMLKDVSPSAWTLITDYHFGGYARFNTELIDFLLSFRKRYGFQLDPIYTGKMLFGLFKMIENGFFEKGTKILTVHTGGLQGNEGFYARHGIKL